MMQLNRLLPLLILLILSSAGTVTSFGPILEPKKGGVGSRLVLRISADNDSVLDSNRMRLERTFVYEVIDDNVDETLLPYRKYVSNDYADAPWFDLSAIACTEDCEECAIPDEYKNLFPEEQIDVMAFLGIRRAEPLRVNRKSLEWE